MNRPKPSDPIDYRYLNMDERCFEASQEDLEDAIGHGTLLAVPNYEYGQVLIAGGKSAFTEGEAIRLCQILSGVIKPPRYYCL